MWDKRRQLLLEKQLASPPRVVRGLSERMMYAKLQEMIGYLSDRQVEDLLAPPRLQEVKEDWAWPPAKEPNPAEFNGKPAELIHRDERLAVQDISRLLVLAVLEYRQKEREEAEKRLQACQERLFGSWWVEGAGDSEPDRDVAIHMD